MAHSCRKLKFVALNRASMSLRSTTTAVKAEPKCEPSDDVTEASAEPLVKSNSKKPRSTFKMTKYGSIVRRRNSSKNGEKTIQQRTLRCDKCMSLYRCKQGLLQHRCLVDFRQLAAAKQETTNELYRCNQCSMVLRSRYGLLNHSCIVAGRDPLHYDCDNCPARFNQRLCLARHIRLLHLGVRAFWCDDCGISFSQEPSYRRHRSNRHQDGVKFEAVCDNCELRFKKRDTVRDHIFSKHTLQKSRSKLPFRCGICRRSYLQAFTLRRHMLVFHARIRQLLHCHECGLGLVSKIALFKHISEEHLSMILLKVKSECDEN